MDEEIQALYGGSDYIELCFETVSLGNLIDYDLEGFAPKYRGSFEKGGSYALAEHWKGDMVEGSFSYQIRGRVGSPDQWAGYSLRMQVNQSVPPYGTKHESEGFLGDGWCGNGQTVLFLDVRPQFARDILDMMVFFEKEQREPRLFYCHLVELKRPSNYKGEGTPPIEFKILKIRCSLS